MLKRKPPVEVAGYLNRLIFVVDIFSGKWGCKWYSVINESGADEDVSP
ncbi:hypothetical protein [Altericroceibacterium endophyticum]|uniref:Uncharacterized protein n=1 Tax=Altericroceibacterium endophyticum TaxID=1808508 RepID=A0A6I4T7P9_9SPHN|nr:hypothetical protein [Altericroceibacterium endophyticum]MXO65880.1 hypothetical protein [Altericroceibacterium endophyticum]